MSAEAGPSQPSQVQQAGKKRKRTGKEREERKQAAILAAQAKAEEPAAEETAGEAETPKEPSEVPTVDFETLETRLPRAVTHLRHVFKRAKTIEMTRLIKKIKHSRSKGGSETELEDLEAQRQIMTHINLTTTLSNHLLVNIRKHRLLKRTPNAIPPSVVTLLSSTSGASTSSTLASADILRKVENRLCSSKAVAQEMKSTVAWVMNEEGAKLGAGIKAGAPQALSSKPGQIKAKSQVDAQKEDDDDEEDEGMDGGDLAPRRGVVVDSEDEEDDEADAAGWESGSISGNDDEMPSTSRRPMAIASDDSDDDEAVSMSPEPIAKKAKPAPGKTSAKTKDTSARLTSSTFLPSLSAGFTRGGSEDSDPDDDFGEGLEDVIGKGGVVRKNRRGQRARQLIWERKYGKNAKHVQKAKMQETEGNIANAYGKRAGQAKAFQTPAPARSTPAPRHAVPSANATPIDRQRNDTASTASKPSTSTSAGLHPSWEAARLRKQKEAAGPKATKIVFD